MAIEGDTARMLDRVSREILPLYDMASATVAVLVDSRELVLRIDHKDDQPAPCRNLRRGLRYTTMDAALASSKEISMTWNASACAGTT